MELQKLHLILIHIYQNEKMFNFLRNLPSTRIIFRPGWNKFSQMMWSQNRTISGQIVKIVHNYSHEQVEHNKWTQKYKWDKIQVGHWRPTGLVKIVNKSGFISFQSLGIAGSTGSGIKHDIWPGFSCGTSVMV